MLIIVKNGDLFLILDTKVKLMNTIELWKNRIKDEWLKSFRNDNRGSTMVEVLVSFVVLVIILLIISQIVSYCYGLMMKAMDIERVSQNFNAELYKQADQMDTAEVNGLDYNYNAASGPVFYLELDYANTEMMNKNVKDSSYDYTKYRIRMNNLEATCYKSINPLIESEELVCPKVLSFRIKE